MWYNKNIENTERTIFMKIRKFTACAAAAVIAMTALSGCREDDPLEGAVVGENSFIMTLYPDIAPITCENFKGLVEDGFYNGLTFHRVVDEFVAQGGDPRGDGTGSSDDAITGEFSANGVANNLSHVRGTVSMARADEFNSATCQFFICYEDLTYLDGSYAAFASVTEGMETVDSFLSVPRSKGRMGEISSPDNPIYILHAEEIEADSAGNPRIQFVIYIDKDTNVNDSGSGLVQQSTAASQPAEITTDDPAAATDISTSVTDVTTASEDDASSVLSTDTSSETTSETVQAVG